MNITTENIDVWCFRYLEKDLSTNELALFENELKNNSTLAKQVSLWNKTVVKVEPLTQVDYTVANTLFRYRNQFLFILIEFVLTTSLVLFLVCNTTKETHLIQRTEPLKIDVLTSPANGNNDSKSIEDVHFDKPIYRNLAIDEENDSIEFSQKEKLQKLELDTIIENKNHITPTIKELDKTNSIEVAPDTTVAHKKSTQNKNTTRRKYRGSRLIPINNDL